MKHSLAFPERPCIHLFAFSRCFRHVILRAYVADATSSKSRIPGRGPRSRGSIQGGYRKPFSVSAAAIALDAYPTTDARSGGCRKPQGTWSHVGATARARRSTDVPSPQTVAVRGCGPNTSVGVSRVGHLRVVCVVRVISRPKRKYNCGQQRSSRSVSCPPTRPNKDLVLNRCDNQSEKCND
jgi:hypothetical protein